MNLEQLFLKYMQIGGELLKEYTYLCTAFE